MKDNARNLMTPHRTGVTLIFSMVLLTSLTAIASLAVDYGRVELTRTELQRCADAAARAAGAQLANGTTAYNIANAQAAAISLAGGNSVTGIPFSLQPSDVVAGNWDSTLSPKFSTARTPVNAIQVTTKCTQARGNSVPLTAANLFGIDHIDITSVAIAAVDTPTSIYAMVGIDRAQFSSVGVIAKIAGDIVSNGDVNVGWSLGVLVGVQGDARSYTGTVSKGGLASITGSTAPLTSKLYYPPVVVPATNNNANLTANLNSNNDFSGAGTVNIPAGTYVVHDLNFLAGLNVNLQGPVTFYVTGSFNMAAGINLLGTSSFDSSNFKVRVSNGGNVNFLANLITPINMDLYAPESDIAVNVGINHYTGVLVGKTLSVNLPVLGSFTENRPAGPVGDTTGAIRLVQ